MHLESGTVIVALENVRQIVRDSEVRVLEPRWLERVAHVADGHVWLENPAGEVRKVYVGSGLADELVDERGFHRQRHYVQSKYESLEHYITYATASVILAADARRRAAAMEEAVVQLRQAADQTYPGMASAIEWHSIYPRTSPRVAASPDVQTAAFAPGDVVILAGTGGSWQGVHSELAGQPYSWTGQQMDEAFARHGRTVVGYPDAGQDNYVALVEAADGTREWIRAGVQRCSCRFQTRPQVEAMVAEARLQRQQTVLAELRRLDSEAAELSSAA